MNGNANMVNNMNPEQQYCVAAEDRGTKIRQAITDPCSYQVALLKKSAMSKNRTWKKTHRYFHVAKHPYKSHKNS